LDCGSLRAREDTSNEEKSGSEEGSCVKGSRMRKPVPPPPASSRRRSMVGRGSMKAHGGIVRSAMCQLGCCCCRFNPGISETEEVRVMCFDNIRQGALL